VATEVVLPMLGITVERGTIVQWLKSEGDSVDKGEIIFVVETDKVATEVESPAGGTLAAILVQAGLEVPVLTPVGVITEPGEELPDKYRAVAPAGETRPAAGGVDALTSPTPPAVFDQPAPDPPARDQTVRAVPAARRLAVEKGLNLSTLAGTGPEGVITLGDVERAVTQAPPSPAPPTPALASTLARRLAQKEGVALDGIQGSGIRGRIMEADVAARLEGAKGPSLGQVIPISSVRRTIARKMSESAFSAPHIYFFTEVEMNPLLDFRSALVQETGEAYGVRLSINDLLIKAVALNLLEFPLLNSRLEEENIVVNQEINVGLAVAQEEGLIVPAVESAHKAGLVTIARQRADLVERARTGQLTMPEIERGTFTVSSLAQYDITHFTAILNPPQVGILSVGRTQDKLFLVDGQVQARKVAVFGLSVDHRIIDGALAADFLQHLKRKLEKPMLTFVHL
jgi:pyruvate dehydrogenase E2 component (dihydrolipoamide acetyltransferase)